MSGYRLPVLAVIAVLLGVLSWYDQGATPPPGAVSTPSAETRAAPRPPAAGPVGDDGKEAPATALQALDNPLAGLSVTDFDETLERPLFMPSRRPPAPPVAPVAQAQQPGETAPDEPDPELFDLLGVIHDEGRRAIALLRHKLEGRYYRVQAGDVLDGWEIIGIEPKAVILKKGEANMTLQVFVQ